ncbi:MAG TPA: TetR family transcriptional regulator [Pseudobdellovibrionaceae bacterium]|nr:TetR family transcriptional regulator [Pseudobdellovibrionaceae bacterium]
MTKPQHLDSTEESKSKKSKSERTAERLYEISIQQFLRRGFDETTMRDLAQAADLSPGAFYYHFPSKEAVIQRFYERTFQQFAEAAREAMSAHTRFEARFISLLEARLATFHESRELLIVLSRAAVDPRSTLSPFGPEQKLIREATIDLMRECIDGSDLSAHKKLETYLPELLWMYMMGMIFYWVFDKSPAQKQTHELIRLLTPQIIRLIRFSRIPLTGRVLQPILQVLQLVIPEPLAARRDSPKRNSRV